MTYLLKYYLLIKNIKPVRMQLNDVWNVKHSLVTKYPEKKWKIIIIIKYIRMLLHYQLKCTKCPQLRGWLISSN